MMAEWLVRWATRNMRTEDVIPVLFFDDEQKRQDDEQSQDEDEQSQERELNETRFVFFSGDDRSTLFGKNNQDGEGRQPEQRVLSGERQGCRRRTCDLPVDQQDSLGRLEGHLDVLCSKMKAIGICEEPESLDRVQTAEPGAVGEPNLHELHLPVFRVANAILEEARHWGSDWAVWTRFERLAEVAHVAVKGTLREPSPLVELRLFQTRQALLAGLGDEKMPAMARQATYRNDRGVHLDGGLSLGTGGFAEVELVDYKGDNRVAKLFNVSKMHIGRTFNRELKVMKELNKSPRIVQVYGKDTARQDGKLVLIMEHMAGGDLAGLLRESGSDPEKRELLVNHRVQFLRDICEGLEFIHSKDYVHRDLKSANVLLGRDLRVKISDFGITKAENAATTNSLNCGSYNYLAPEVLNKRMLNGERVGSKRDIYAFGIICWEVLTQNVPWQGLEDCFIIQNVVGGKRPPTPSSAPASIVIAMEKAWTHKPTKRPTATELREILAQEAVETPLRRITTDVVETLRGWTFPRSMLVTIAVMLLIAAYFAVQMAWIVVPGSRDSPTLDDTSFAENVSAREL